MTTPQRHGGLADVLDDHLAAEFATRDLDATMATMTDDPYLNHVPVLTGGIGREEVRRPRRALATVIDVRGRKVLHLLPGDVEPDSVLDPGHGADRDGDLPAPPQMPLPDQHVGNPVVVRIDEQAPHPPDLTIESMNVVTGTHLCSTRRDNLLDDEPGRP